MRRAPQQCDNLILPEWSAQFPTFGRYTAGGEIRDSLAQTRNVVDIALTRALKVCG